MSADQMPDDVTQRILTRLHQEAAMSHEEEVLSALDFVTTCDMCDDTASRVMHMSCVACHVQFTAIVCGLHRSWIQHPSPTGACPHCHVTQYLRRMVDADEAFDGSL